MKVKESELVKERRLFLQKKVGRFYEVDPFHKMISLPSSGEVKEEIAEEVEELKSFGYGVQFELDLRFSTHSTAQPRDHA